MKKTSCVAIVVRHEEQYIQECICYNYLLGWDAIIIVVHSDPTDNHPDRTENLINNLPGHVRDKVIVIPFEYTPEHHIVRNHQNIAYQELVYPIVKDKFEWMAMFDADEYLYDSKRRKINEILESAPGDTGQVILTSLTFGHNNQIISAPPTETRLRWFNKRNHQISHKSIVHIDSIVNTGKWYYCNFAKVVGQSINFDNPCLIHYESGAMEDWVNRQYKWNKHHVENKPDYDRFIGNFTAGTKDNRMLIYTNKLDTLLKQCNTDISETISEFVMPEYNPDTPVLFLIFNRANITRQVFSQIRKMKPGKLYIAADGRCDQEEKVLCEHAGEIAVSIDWNCEVFTLPMDKNYGYEQIINRAISWFFENEPEGIILEDDCLPADGFFGFCSAMLERYRNDERIGHISGGNFQKGMIRGDGSYYFSALMHVWGWAGWRRVWKGFDLEMEYSYLYEKIERMKQMPAHNHIKNYWNYKLQPLYYEKCNTWRFLYSYHQIINNRLSVISNSNLITKIGYSEGPTDFIKNHPFADIPLSDMDSIVRPSSMVADREADIYSLNLEIKMLPSEFYGNEFYFLKNKLLSVVSAKNNCMKIPKIIHQIYFDMAGPPEFLLLISETWKEKHPTWEYRFWDEKAIEQFMTSEFQDFIPLFRSFPFDVQRWNFVRYLILYRFGGLYVDMDYECLEPMDSLLNNELCCMGMEPAAHAIRNNKSYIIGNALMASVPDHDFFAHIIKDISASNRQNHVHKRTQVMESTGPFMLNRVYDAYEKKDDVTLLPAELVAPLSLEEIQKLTAGIETTEIKDKVEKAFALHYFRRSWFQ